MTERRLPAWLAPAALALLVAAIFLPTVRFSFLPGWDDDLYILADPMVRAPELLSWDLWLSPRAGYPVGVTTLTWAANHAIHGFAPAGYHLGNVLLHALNAVLVLFVLERVGIRRRFAGFGALLFALHPIVAEPVSWATGRKDLLATALVLGAVLLWLRLAPGRRARVLAVLLFAGAALAKPSVWAIPAFFLLWRPKGGKRLLELAGVQLVLLGLFTALMLRHPGRAVGATEDVVMPVATYVEHVGAVPLRALRALGVQLSLLVRPGALGPLYILPEPRWSEPATVAGIAFVLGLAALFLSRRVRASRAWPLLLLLAAAQLPNAMNALHRLHEVGDSHEYLPLVAIAGLAALGLERLVAGARPAVQLAVLAALPVTLAPLTLAACRTWRDPVTFWRAVHARYPDQPRLCNALGVAHGRRGEMAEALAVLDRCARGPARDSFLHNLVLAAAAADDPRFPALAAELMEKQPDDPLAKDMREFLRTGKPLARPDDWR